MTSNDFRARVRQEDGVPVIDLIGEVNSSAEEMLTAAFAEASTTNPSTVLLNFSDTSYMNSTGIALVVALLAQARKARMQLLVCGLSDHYRHIFSITRLADFMNIHEDEASAINAATVVAEG